ncbi:hypothetical protein GYMLUDRAFT_171184 [Collybiopsis luxurians FD-317 M1]|uniref:tripeptidyl-peptidase II n=1 Tax=Collybiopsis luxurians FD-317 M1 TaxID=944289 RepID=A0A0D0BSG4_9AGAR|nr:hypothetical protein GYMLUDRAFT_171184 [Collybiopsis luxurians FD-317 M1]
MGILQIAAALCLVFPLQSTSKALALHIRQASESLPQGFVQVGPPSNDTPIDIRIGLQASDNAGLEQKLYQVSTPGSAFYGKYLSRDEVKSYAAPSADSVAAVTSWLESQNVSVARTGAFGEYLSISIPVSRANELLNAKYMNFTYADSTSAVSSSTLETWGLYTYAYSIPEDLTQHITLVHPTTAFAPPLKRNGRKTTFYPASKSNSARTTGKVATRANPAPASCETLVPPSCLQSLYGIPSTPATQKSNTIGVTSLESNWAEETDLQAFLTEFRPDMSPNTTFTLVSVANGTNPQVSGDGSFEASLDVQYTIGLATDVPTEFISVGQIFVTNFFSDLMSLAEYLSTVDNPPQVVTTSYGVGEGFLQGSQDSIDLAIQVCNSFMAASARGISLLFSSGGCTAGTTNASLFPAFPSSCPYVTAVGSVTGISPEIASNFSTGGFSTFFSRPSYQDTAISSYLAKLGSTNQGLYSPNGRATPDIAAQGENIPIITNGKQVLELGTSASSPIVASVISLVNDKLVQAGKPVLGFLNPFIYSNPQAFFDIINGSNPGLIPSDCFDAVEGWDPATGFGTPNFDAIVAAAGL